MRPEPAGALGFSLDRVTLGVDQHLAAPDMIGLADQPILLHPFNQARGTVVTDAQLTLEVAGRRLLALRDDLYRLAVHLGLGIVLADRLPVEQVSAVLGLFGDRLIIF